MKRNRLILSALLAALMLLATQVHGQTFPATIDATGTATTPDGKVYQFKVEKAPAVFTPVTISLPPAPVTQPATQPATQPSTVPATQPTTPPVTPPVVVSGWPTKAGTTPQGTLTAGAKPAAGQTIRNKTFKGTVDLRNLKGVKFYDCLFDANGSMFAVRTDDGSTSAADRYFERCEFRNASEDLVYGGGFTVVGSYLHDTGGDPFKPKDWFVIRGCFAERWGKNAGAHGDFVQVWGRSNGVIEGNWIDAAQVNTNAAIMIHSKDAAKPKNVVFRKNHVDGGGGNLNYAINGDSDTASCVAEGNTFVRGSMKFGNSNGAMKWGTGNVDQFGKPTTASTK